MAVNAAKRKNPAAVALGRKGGKRGGPARAAKLSPEQRSESARNAVQARWARAKRGKFRQSRPLVKKRVPATPRTDTSDEALLALLRRLRTTNDRSEIRQLSHQLERVIFHRQFENA